MPVHASTVYCEVWTSDVVEPERKYRSGTFFGTEKLKNKLACAIETGGSLAEILGYLSKNYIIVYHTIFIQKNVIK